tara:strand:+ start:16611 stop:16859 length:249 start_codon:yes stop_codon:yes gene_type:complete
MYGKQDMIDQSAPILDFETLQYELSKVWKVLPALMPKSEYINQDINECVQEIFEHMIYDYWKEVNNKRGKKAEMLNYKLGEA